MKIIRLSAFDETEDFDDGMYFVAPENIGDEDPEEVRMEAFSDGDLFIIRHNAPTEADAMAMTDDWMFYNTENGMLFDYVFK